MASPWPRPGLTISQSPTRSPSDKTWPLDSVVTRRSPHSCSGTRTPISRYFAKMTNGQDVAHPLPSSICLCPSHQARRELTQKSRVLLLIRTLRRLHAMHQRAAALVALELMGGRAKCLGTSVARASGNFLFPFPLLMALTTSAPRPQFTILSPLYSHPSSPFKRSPVTAPFPPPPYHHNQQFYA